MGLGRRISLAFRAFFALLRHGTLPAEIVTAATDERPAAAEAAPPAVTAAPPVERPDDGAVLMLAVLQRESRLVDFLMEDLGAYSDARIGAAVRDVHASCRRVLERYLAIEPILADEEGQITAVRAPVDPATVKLVGAVGTQAIYRGTVRHRGWRAGRVELPPLAAADARLIVAPAEVELT
jgi:hypothetical protein